MTGALAVRLPNWLGDTVMAVPALRALRAAHGGVPMVLAGPWATALAGQDLGDTLVTYPRAWSRRLAAADAVRRCGPEIAVTLPNSLESALAAWYWGAGRRIGFAGGGRELLLTDVLPLPEPRRHQIDEYLMLAERCEAVTTSREPRLDPPDPDNAERREARALLADSAGRRCIAIHLGAAYGPSKTWPLERVADLCRLLDADGARAVLLGAPDDAAAAEQVAAIAPATVLAGRDRPALLPALLSEVDALVCGDTGVGHLAAALGTPVVVLFGPTDPALSAPRGAVRVLTHAVPCAPCFYRVCPIEHPCLRDLAAVRVREALETFVGARR
jgi:lipopolysaccharide heptosyltransferase II